MKEITGAPMKKCPVVRTVMSSDLVAIVTKIHVLTNFEEIKFEFLHMFEIRHKTCSPE